MILAVIWGELLITIGTYILIGTCFLFCALVVWITVVFIWQSVFGKSSRRKP